MRPILFSLLFLVVLTIAVPANGWGQRRVAASRDPEVEQIYVAHAVRLSRVKATGFCNEKRIGPGRALWEDQFGFRSIKTRPSDGRVLPSDGPTIGEMHVCFGSTEDAAVVSFYAEGTLAKVPFTGKGECLTVKREFPESGLTTMRCFLDLQGLPDDYVGGQLTSNTVLSRVAVGHISDPSGYTQPSIITARLWRHRS